MLKVAILSSWHVHAREYVAYFKGRSDVELTCMWDENIEAGKKFSQEYDLEFVESLDDLLKRADVEAVCITTPTNLHKEVMIKCANAKKHIFTEKVLAFTNEEAKEVKQAVLTNDIKFAISFPHRTFTHNLYAKQILEENKLGQVTYVRMRNAHNGASAGWLPDYFYDEKLCGGGAMMDLGAHPMYLIRWLLGKPIQMSSTFTQVKNKGVDDNSVSVMTYANGAIAVSETGFVSSHSPATLELHGTEGTLIIQNGEVTLNGEKVDVSVMPRPTKHSIDMFVDGVLKGDEIMFDIVAAVGLTEMMDAAYRSYKQGTFVQV